MKTALIIALLFLNVFSIVMSIKMLKGFEKLKIAIYILLGELITFTMSNVIYALTANGVPAEVHQISKWMIVLTMLPVNIITIFCPIANLINKKAFDEVQSNTIKKRVIIIGIVTLAVIIFEIMYVNSIQIGISSMAGK